MNVGVKVHVGVAAIVGNFVDVDIGVLAGVKVCVRVGNGVWLFSFPAVGVGVSDGFCAVRVLVIVKVGLAGVLDGVAFTITSTVGPGKGVRNSGGIHFGTGGAGFVSFSASTFCVPASEIAAARVAVYMGVME